MSEHPADLWLLAEGVLTAIVIVGTGMLTTTGIRRQNHTRAKLENRELPFSLPTTIDHTLPTENIPTDRALYELIQAEHNAAKALQDQTVAYLVGASLTLFAAFAGSVASVTILSADEAFHLYAAALDITALVLVVWAFGRSGTSRAMWIRQRVVTELLRHWAATDYLLIKSSLAFTSRYDAFVESVTAATQEPNEDHLNAIVDFASTRLQELRRLISDEANLSPASMRRYLERRAIRQARWFATAQHRVSGLHNRRRQLMLCLFGAAFTSSVAKLFASLDQNDKVASWGTCALLIAIGVAAASTSTYLGQNVRSLHHRYNSQLRILQSWFVDYSDIFQLALKVGTFEPVELTRLADAVISFEALMLSELTDWIAISVNDTMEIAPG